MGYLLYVSHDAENLQFYLWLEDYKRRFNVASGSEKALSPEWHEDALPPSIGNVVFDQCLQYPDKMFAEVVDSGISFDSTDIPSSLEGSLPTGKVPFSIGSQEGSIESKPSFTVQPANIGYESKWQPCESG